MGHGMVEKKEATARKFNLAQFMTSKHVKAELTATTKEGVIDELLQILVDQGSIQDLQAAKKAVWERERKMTTGLEEGIAIPHGKTDTVDRLVCAVGISRQGIDFESLDGEDARIFVVTLSPLSKPAPHIQFMSTIGQLLDEAGRMYLMDPRSPQEIYDFMTGGHKERKTGIMSRGAKANEAFKLSDYLKPKLMVTELKGVTTEEVIHELLTVMKDAKGIADVDEAAAKVLERERQMSTAMEEGLALPHARTDLVENLTCAIGIKPAGIDFDGDGVAETTIVIMVLTPESEGKPYLQFVASVLKALDKGGRERLLSAKSTRSMVNVFTG
jgi:mannitol/fructose-specific phosphotransferase system IIA component (Ntr-type)